MCVKYNLSALRSRPSCVRKKVVNENGKLSAKPQSMAWKSDVVGYEVRSLASLAAALDAIAATEREFIVRGRLKKGVSPKQVRRTAVGPNANFEDAPCPWLCFDFDKIPYPSHLCSSTSSAEEIVRHVQSLLPGCFREVDCHWRFSSSMGIEPDCICLHIYFWLDRPVPSREAKVWLQDVDIADKSVLGVVQPIFVAPPKFPSQSDDPVPIRSGILRAGHGRSVVSVPLDLQLKAARTWKSVERTGSGGNGCQEIIRNKAGLVVDGRERHLFECCLKAVREATPSKPPKGFCLEPNEVADKAWEDFAQTSDLSVGKWQKLHAFSKVERLVQLFEEGWKPNGRRHWITLKPDVTPSFPLDEVSLEEGEAALSDAIGGFFDDFENGRKPKRAIAATMGLGKSRAFLHRVAELARRNPLLKIDVYAPTHKLCEELAERIVDAGLPSDQAIVLKGRSQRLSDGTPVCPRFDELQGLEKKGYSIRANACYRSEEEKCDHYETCAYWRMRNSDSRSKSVHFKPHSYLATPKADSDTRKPDLVVIDETPLTSMLKRRRIKDSEVRQLFTAAGRPDLAKLVVRSLEDREPLLRKLRETQVTPQFLEDLKAKPGTAVSVFNVSAQEASQAISAAGNNRSFDLAAFGRVLAEEMRHHPNRDDVTRLRYDGHHHSVVIDELVDPPFDPGTPLLLLDATADERLVEKVFGIVDFDRIDVVQNQHVVQVSDRTGSNDKLSEDEPLNEIDRLLRTVAASGKKVLCLASKEVADALAVRGLPPKVFVDHFNNVRGVDCYKECEVVVIAGRNQPPQADIEGQARAIYWDDDKPLRYDEAAAINAPPHLDMPGTEQGYSMSDPDQKWGVAVRSFSDPRIEGVHKQSREASSLQGMARVRPVRADHAKTILILSNLPVATKVDELVEWNDLMPGVVADAIEQGTYIPLTREAIRRVKAAAGCETSCLESTQETNEKCVEWCERFANLLGLRWTIVCFKATVDGKPTGRLQKALFVEPKKRPRLPAELVRCLEEGVETAPGSRWGQVRVLGFEERQDEGRQQVQSSA